MPAESPTRPVEEDSVSKVNNDIAVGSDLEFQRRWWHFEIAIWTVFTLFVILGLLGFFGRGHFAKGETAAKDGTIDVKYEKIERFGTPSLITVQFGPNATREGKVKLWAGKTLFKDLGAQRIAPQPLESVIGEDGFTYTFPAEGKPESVQLALQPTSAGRSEIQLRVPGSETVTAKVLVLP